MGAGLEVFLFGRLRIEREGSAVPAAACAKARELLAFLVVHRGRAQRREAVAERLWGEDGAGDPRRALRQALWRLRTGLAGRPPVRILGADWLELDPRADLWVDAVAFEDAWKEARRAPGRALAAPAWRRAEKALGLYTDDLLEGCSWEWCAAERQRLRDAYFDLAEEVLERHVAAGEHALGVRLGAEILRHDPSHESTHWRLMLLHAGAGERTAALRQYERCAAALRQEFGVAPGPRTRELVERLRSGSAPPAAEGPRPGAGPPAVSSVLDGLHHLRDLLSDARREVHLEIQAIEQALKPRR